LEELRRRIVEALDVDLLRDRPAITNIRHITLVERAHPALGRARAAALAEGGAMSEEFILADLSVARKALQEISGRRAPEDLLAHIFSRFCIGKSNSDEQFIRRDRDWGRPRRLRSGARGGAARCARRPLHSVYRHGGAHALQSRDWWDGKGASRARNRCARRSDGPGDRCHGYPVQAAESQPRPGSLVAPRAGRQEGLRALDEGDARRIAERRMADWQGGTHS